MWTPGPPAAVSESRHCSLGDVSLTRILDGGPVLQQTAVAVADGVLLAGFVPTSAKKENKKRQSQVKLCSTELGKHKHTQRNTQKLREIHTHTRTRTNTDKWPHTITDKYHTKKKRKQKKYTHKHKTKKLDTDNFNSRQFGVSSLFLRSLYVFEKRKWTRHGLVSGVKKVKHFFSSYNPKNTCNSRS